MNEQMEMGISILPVVGIMILAVSIIGYFYASKLKWKKIDRLRKDERTALKKKRTLVATTAHISLTISVIILGTYYIQNTVGKYNIENLNYQAEIDVKNDIDYGDEHSEANVTYEMNIPTSGTHSPHDSKYGFYKESQAYDTLVHNLEHGDIVIYYRPDATDDIIEKLRVLTHYRKAGSGVLAVPSDDIPMNAEVVVTAWEKTMELPVYDEAKIGTFVYQFINQGPESISAGIRGNGGM